MPAIGNRTRKTTIGNRMAKTAITTITPDVSEEMVSPGGGTAGSVGATVAPSLILMMLATFPALILSTVMLDRVGLEAYAMLMLSTRASSLAMSVSACMPLAAAELLGNMIV